MTPADVQAFIGHPVVVTETSSAFTAGGVISLPADALKALGGSVDRDRAQALYVLLHERSHAVDQDAGNVYTCPGSEVKSNREAARAFVRSASILYRSLSVAWRLWDALPAWWRDPMTVDCPTS